MIELKNLKVSYTESNGVVTAIEDVNLEVGHGEICAIIGPSGGGKSTLLKVLAGIVKDYEGIALIDGMKMNPKTNRIGFIPQNYGLVKWKTVEKNIFLSAKIKDGKKHIDKGYYKDILEKLGLIKLRYRYPHKLSGGQQQRVSIARAFLLKPNLLLMDEPFSALDEMTKKEVQKLFLEVWKEHRVTTLIVTHDVREATALGHKIGILSSMPGKMVSLIENPLFGKEYKETDPDYEALKNKIGEGLKDGRRL